MIWSAPSSAAAASTPPAASAASPPVDPALVAFSATRVVQDARALAMRLAATVFVASLLIAAFAGWVGLSAAGPELTAEISKNSAGVARTLARQFQTAIAAGVPLDRLYDVEPLLQETLDAAPSLRAVQIEDAAGAVLHRVGSPLSAATLDSAWSGVAQAAQPIVVDGVVVGRVRVGSDLGPLKQQLHALLGVTVAALLIGGLLAGVAFHLTLRLTWTSPAQRLHRACLNVAHGDFSVAAVPVGDTAFVVAHRALNADLRAVCERRRRLDAAADTLRAESPPPEALAKLNALFAPLDAGRHFTQPEAAPLRPSEDGALALIALALAAAAEAARPLVPDMAYAGADGTLGRFIVVAPAFAFGFAAALALAALRALQDKPSAWAFLVGGVAAAAGAAVAGWGDGVAAAMLSRGLTGAGLVLCLSSLSRRRDDVAALALGAEAVGPLLGGLGAALFGQTATLTAAAVAIAGCATLGARRARRRPPASPHRGDEGWRGPTLAVGVGWIVGVISHSLIPGLWLTEDHAAAGAAAGAFGAMVTLGATLGRIFPPLSAGVGVLIGGGAAAFGFTHADASPLILLGLGLIGLFAGAAARHMPPSAAVHAGIGVALGAVAAGFSAAWGDSLDWRLAAPAAVAALSAPLLALGCRRTAPMAGGRR